EGGGPGRERGGRGGWAGRPRLGSASCRTSRSADPPPLRRGGFWHRRRCTQNRFTTWSRLRRNRRGALGARGAPEVIMLRRRLRDGLGLLGSAAAPPPAPPST